MPRLYPYLVQAYFLRVGSSCYGKSCNTTICLFSVTIVRDCFYFRFLRVYIN